MKLIAGLLISLALLSGCMGDVYVNSTTVITSKPSWIQEKFPRGELFMSCTTIAGLYDYLDNYKTGDLIPNGCGYRPMTAVTSRGQYESYWHGLVNIFEFQHGWEKFFTYDSVRRHAYRY